MRTIALFLVLYLSSTMPLGGAFVAPNPSSFSVNSGIKTDRPSPSAPFTTCSATRAPDATTLVNPNFDTSYSYSDQELQDALNSLLNESSDPDFDARHIYGYKDANHKLSMLQRITATVLLDYQNYLEKDGHPSLDELKQIATTFQQQHGAILNLQTVIQSQAPRMALAAEFKRASPSKGDIAPDLEAGAQGLQYAEAGADIISILTEARWFKGTLQDLTQVRLATTNKNNKDGRYRPAILRKDFVVNEYMIAEAAAAGADTVLLIVAVLPQHLLQRLIEYCRQEFEMEPLVEVHADCELQVALQAGAKVIGVNNRNLHTFQIDLATSERVAQQLEQAGHSFFHRATIEEQQQQQQPPDLTLCALSGMSTAFDVDRYRQVGLGMCLIGESLMRAADPAAAIAGLCLHPDDFARQMQSSSSSGGAYTAGTQLIKVCGITNPSDALVACQSGANLIGVIFAEKSKRKVTAEQAKEVVDTVRKFGERCQATRLNLPTARTAALPHLVASSRALMEGCRQRPMVVGVFQNQDPAFIQKMVNECGLDLVQLHGSEGMAAANVEQCGVPAIRVVDIAVDPETGETSSQAVESLLESITSDPVAILLDTAIKGRKEGGGTGQAFDWGIAQRVQDAGLPVIIAGGLTAESVKECVGSIRPFGVDVSSGVEAAPGKKDQQQVREFVEGARKAAVEASKGF